MLVYLGLNSFLPRETHRLFHTCDWRERSEWQENQFGQNVHWENQSNLQRVIRAILICEKGKENVAQKFKNHSSEMTAREKRACAIKKRQGMFQMLPFLIQ